VRIDYNVSVDEILGPFTTYQRQVGFLDPAQSVLVEVLVSVPTTTSILRGSIVLRTAGQGTLWTWSVSVRALLPDLLAMAPIGFEPVDPVLGDGIRLIATLRNIGEGSARDLTYEFRDGDELIGSAIVTELGADQEVSVSDVIWTPKATGEHEVTLMLDPGAELIEQDRSNNKVSRTYSFWPDLSIMNAEPSVTTLGPDEPFTVLVTVENEGNAPLSSGFRVFVRAGSIDGKEVGSEVSSLLLHPTKEATGTVELKLTAPESAGDLKLFVTVAAESSSDGEGDPSDNTFELTGLKVKDGGQGTDRTMLYIFLALGALIVLALVGGGIYLWKRDEGPEPEGEGTGIVLDTHLEAAGMKVGDVTVEAEGGPDEAGPEKGSDNGGMPILTMDLEDGPIEGPLVAEVLDEVPVEDRPVKDEGDDEEGLIPEI
jgi:hypothetical protein